MFGGFLSFLLILYIWIQLEPNLHAVNSLIDFWWFPIDFQLFNS